MSNATHADPSAARIFGGIFLITVAMVFGVGGVASWAEITRPLGEYSWEWIHGIARLAAAAAAVGLLYRKGWLEQAGVTRTWSRLGQDNRRLRVALVTILTAATIAPALGLFTSSFSLEAVAANVWYFATVGPNEELIFRGVIFVALLRLWSDRANGLLIATVVSSFIFGAAHIAPAAIVITTITGITMAGLVVATRSIWPAVVAHSLYDIVAAFPMNDAGESTDTLWHVVAFGLYSVGAVLSIVLIRRLGPDFMSLEARAVGRAASEQGSELRGELGQQPLAFVG